VDARELDRHLGTTAPGGAAPGRDPEPRHEASGHGHATSRPCDAVPHVPQARVGLGRLHEVRGVQVAVTEMEPGSASGARPLSAGRRRRRRAARWPRSGARWASGRPSAASRCPRPIAGRGRGGGQRPQDSRLHETLQDARAPGRGPAPRNGAPWGRPRPPAGAGGAGSGCPRPPGSPSRTRFRCGPGASQQPSPGPSVPSWASAWRDDRWRGAALTRRVEDARHCRAGMPRVTSPRENGADVPPSAPTLLSSLNVKPCTCSFSRRLNCM